MYRIGPGGRCSIGSSQITYRNRVKQTGDLQDKRVEQFLSYTLRGSYLVAQRPQ